MPVTRPHRSRGSVTVEAALVTFLWIGLVSATFEFGRYYLVAMHTQDVARVAARELAGLPLPATMTFDAAMADPGVRQAVFDPRELVIDISGMDQDDIDDAIAALPPINRLLAPLMVRETVDHDDDAGTPELRILRYPGALVQDTDPSSPTGLSVVLPVVASDTQGQTILRWAAVIEEERAAADPLLGHFPIDSPSAMAGMVGLRVNYPFHSVAWAARETCDDDPLPAFCDPDTGLGALRLADDTVVQVPALPPPYQVLDAGPREIEGTGRDLYGGTTGLGSLRVAGTEVRPFRRLLSSAAWARRGVFTGS